MELNALYLVPDEPLTKACITGDGPPTPMTKGEVGSLYMDVSGQKGFCPIYKCIATAEDNDGELAATLWEQIDEGENSVSFTDV